MMCLWCLIEFSFQMRKILRCNCDSYALFFKVLCNYSIDSLKKKRWRFNDDFVRYVLEGCNFIKASCQLE